MMIMLVVLCCLKPLRNCVLCFIQISEALKVALAPSSAVSYLASVNGSLSLASSMPSSQTVDPTVEFRSLQYSLFMTCIVEVIGSSFFLSTANYISWDRHQAEKAVAGMCSRARSKEALLKQRS
jgi:hypothetical protein